MALEGTLRDFSLADIFQLIGIQKKTGVLTLKHQDEVVTVSFLNGCVVSADSLKKKLEDRLGHVLVKTGRISQERLLQALTVQKQTRQRLGYILVRHGFIDERELKEALKLQITQIVYRLFRWHDGDYHFSQEETVEYDRENFTPLSAESILMEGIRMIDEWPIIERKIKSFEMVFRKTRSDVQPVVAEVDEEAVEDLDSTLAGRSKEPERHPAGAPRLALLEAEVYELVDARRSVQEIIDRGQKGEFETCRILYDLLSRNLIQLANDSSAAVHAAPRRITAGPILEKLGYLALAAALVGSVATMDRSPLSGSPGLLTPPGAMDEIDELVARNRIERLDEAIQVYYLQKGFYPDDLKELVRGKLVAESALKDPWGRSYGFISSSQGYRIIGYDEGGVENPSRGIGRLRPVALPAGPAQAPAARASERPGPTP
ncbi:MAG TPA: DUF4388 domain-containing protein, partial [Candidatus Polarisedimenticolia bacterium]|nr:DUF4388 domain-containing protein [Candidatus Polarisedimenticolia bacterium]